MKKENNNSSDFKWKLGIVLLWIWIFAIAVAGFSYYTWPIWLRWSSTGIGSCPMMNNTTKNTSNQWWWCGMMWARNTAQNNSSTQNQNTIQDQTSPITPTDSKSEVITMDYNDSGLTPSVVNVQIGKSYTIVINANTDVYGCMSTIDIPWLDENTQTIRKWKTITFNIKPTTAGEYPFLCAMWISHNAKIVVK